MNTKRIEELRIAGKKALAIFGIRELKSLLSYVDDFINNFKEKKNGN